MIGSGPASGGHVIGGGGPIRLWRRLWWLVLAIALVPAAPALAQPVVKFTDVSAAAGLAGPVYEGSTGHSLGVNWIDYNRDGWPDIFAVGGGPGKPAKLYRNRGDGTFEDVSALLPFIPDVEMAGSVFADVDNDGDPDLYVYLDNDSFGPGAERDGPPNALLRNLWVENGYAVSTPLFQNIGPFSGLHDLPPVPFGPGIGYRTKTAAWFDYDRDGCLDIFVGHFVSFLVDDEANRDRLYRNECDAAKGYRSFEDTTAASGINAGTDPTTYRPTLASIAAHLNNDLWPDLYAVNAAGSHNDFIFHNDGNQTTFTEKTATWVGIGDDSAAGMGIDVGDVNNDGYWDVYISDLLDTMDSPPYGNVLYLGDSSGNLQDNSAPTAGVVGDNSWGVVFFDVENDGDEDLYVGTLDTMDVVTPADFLYLNDGTGLFTDAAASMGDTSGNRRGAAVADFDRDGDQDLAVVNNMGPLQVYRNDTTGGGRWLRIRLVGAASLSNRDAIGAIVKVRVGAEERMRQVVGGMSTHSQDSLIVHFGLGDLPVGGGSMRTVDEVEVQWPSGAVDVHPDVITNQQLTLVEGSPIRAECNDGVDNDGDGLVDHPADPGCLNGTWGESPQCDDGVDNDGDGTADTNGANGLPPDPQCEDAAHWPIEGPPNNGCGSGYGFYFCQP